MSAVAGIALYAAVNPHMMAAVVTAHTRLSGAVATCIAHSQLGSTTARGLLKHLGPRNQMDNGMHLAGMPGFVEVMQDSCSLRWPDYVGNNMFQTLVSPLPSIPPQEGLVSVVATAAGPSPAAGHRRLLLG
jgi:hypothetical protein